MHCFPTFQQNFKKNETLLQEDALIKKNNQN